MTTKEYTPSDFYQKKANLFAKERLGGLLLVVMSWCIIALATPAFFPNLAPVATSIGFCLFFLHSASLSNKARTLYGFVFFFGVQALQLWWFTSHPFLYIWSVYFTVCTLLGLQFGLLSFLATKKRVSSIVGCLFLASVWTLLEWSRLFWFSGFYFNIVGMYLAANIYSLQVASIVGTLGMSFYVMATNFFFTRAFFSLKKAQPLVFALFFALLPYTWGYYQFQSLEEKQRQYDLVNPPISALIIHAQYKPEIYDTRKNISPLDRAWERWQEIFAALQPYKGQNFDFILFPEVIVPFGSSSLIYLHDLVHAEFQNTLNAPFIVTDNTYVSSEDIAKSLASAFEAPLIIGLEGTETPIGEKRKFFNSAFFFTGANYPSIRYDKQVLVPMGEYVPFSWAYALANNYGIFDSFTPGTAPKVFSIGPHRVAPSICYEETFSNLMRKNSDLGATCFVNLTDDYWFPFSNLGNAHFDHAKPRTVENGIPLIRACNFGISGAVDSLGKSCEIKTGTKQITAFSTKVSSYHYSTLYSKFGNWPLLSICSLLCLYYFFRRNNLDVK